MRAGSRNERTVINYEPVVERYLNRVVQQRRLDVLFLLINEVLSRGASMRPMWFGDQCPQFRQMRSYGHDIANPDAAGRDAGYQTQGAVRRLAEHDRRS